MKRSLRWFLVFTGVITLGLVGLPSLNSPGAWKVWGSLQSGGLESGETVDSLIGAVVTVSLPTTN